MKVQNPLLLLPSPHQKASSVSLGIFSYLPAKVAHFFRLISKHIQVSIPHAYRQSCKSVKIIQKLIQSLDIEINNHTNLLFNNYSTGLKENQYFFLSVIGKILPITETIFTIKLFFAWYNFIKIQFSYGGLMKNTTFALFF